MYLARDIPAFVMHCVNGESGSSLLIKSTDSLIEICTSNIMHSKTECIIVTFIKNM